MIDSVRPDPQLIAHGDLALKIMEGNWWKFPPPVAGRYDIRWKDAVGTYKIALNAPVQSMLAGGNRLRLVFNGRLCETALKLAGYEFRFTLGGLRQEVFMPFRVHYRDVGDGVVKSVELDRREPLMHKLPIARSDIEARYIITRLPELWPEFNGVHIEYVEHKL